MAHHELINPLHPAGNTQEAIYLHDERDGVGNNGEARRQPAGALAVGFHHDARVRGHRCNIDLQAARTIEMNGW